jgi:hypothetical protein
MFAAFTSYIVMYMPEYAISSQRNSDWIAGGGDRRRKTLAEQFDRQDGIFDGHRGHLARAASRWRE